MFGSQPNATAHVNEIKKKFRSRFWSLIHLRRAGFVGNYLIKMFNIFLRPIIEYCSAIYHPILTKEQAADIVKVG